MAKYFGDIAKGCKDILSGGISYDNKFNVSTKVGGHVRWRANPALKPFAFGRKPAQHATRQARRVPVEAPRNSRFSACFPRTRPIITSPF